MRWIFSMMHSPISLTLIECQHMHIITTYLYIRAGTGADAVIIYCEKALFRMKEPKYFAALDQTHSFYAL